MQVISAHAEIQWAGKVGCQAEFLAELPCMLDIEIFGHDAIGTAELGIAEYRGIRWNTTGACQRIRAYNVIGFAQAVLLVTAFATLCRSP